MAEVPASEITSLTVSDLAGHLKPGDVIADGGNTCYRDDIARAKALTESGLHYVDVGTSGGVQGLGHGYCLMIGSEDEAVGWLRPIFKTTAPRVVTATRTPGRDGEPTPSGHGYLHCRPAWRRAPRQDGP